MKRHKVTITFSLLEEVTPRIFAGRVAEACARYGTLRPGERVIYVETGGYEVTEVRSSGDDSVADWLLGPSRVKPAKPTNRRKKGRAT